MTIAVLTFGNHPQLAKQVLNSIRHHCARPDYRLVVGANAVCPETDHLLRERRELGEIDRLIVSPVNLHKCRMMRRMFEQIDAEFIWWFDDDSYITSRNALPRWLEAARASPPSVVQWGPCAWCSHSVAFTDMGDPAQFVRTASWYGGLTPPSWRPGGKGEFDFQGLGTGDGRWFFILGGCFMIRTSAVRRIDWPDPRLHYLGDDVFLSEAVRQQGWGIRDVSFGVAVNTEARRGCPMPAPECQSASAVCL